MIYETYNSYAIARPFGQICADISAPPPAGLANRAERGRDPGAIDTLRGPFPIDLIFGDFLANEFEITPDPGIPTTQIVIGGLGTDTVTLALELDTWLNADFQSELAEWLSAAEPGGKGEFFNFSSLNVTLFSIEVLEITVDGVSLSLADDPVVVVDDAYLIDGETSILAGNVAANDSALDLIASVEVLSGPDFGTLSLGDTGAFTFEVDRSATEYLAALADDSATATFTYRLTDADGDMDVGQVEIEVQAKETAQFGFTVTGGINEEAGLGFSVTGAGDLNGDGIDDAVIGAPQSIVGGDLLGAAYIIYGQDTGAMPLLYDVAELDGELGTAIVGIGEAGTAYSVAGLGDMNGDGIADFAAAVNGADIDGKEDAGAVHVIFGKTGGIDVGAFADLDGSNGFSLLGAAAFDRFGYKISSAGDVNNDGIMDLLIGAYGVDVDGNESVGAAYVIYGKDTGSGPGFEASYDIADLSASDGFIIRGLDARDNAGHSVAWAGDVNGDGIDDFLIGAYGADRSFLPNAGEVYLIYGVDGSAGESFGAELDLSTLDSSQGVTFRGAEFGESVGRAVAAAGDINNDGIDDIALTGFGYTELLNNDGRIYVVYGRDPSVDSPFAGTTNLATTNGNTGFVIEPLREDELLGRSVAALGDMNDDGIDDLAVSAFFADVNGEEMVGELYLIFGRDQSGPDPFEQTFDLSTLDGKTGYLIKGQSMGDASGYSLSRAGDLNADGYDDIIVGAPQAGQGGQTYVIFGGATALEEFDAADGLIDGVIDLALLAPIDGLM